jgi:AAA domain/DnaB-like helicase N terminal domain
VTRRRFRGRLRRFAAEVVGQIELALTRTQEAQLPQVQDRRSINNAGRTVIEADRTDRAPTSVDHEQFLLGALLTAGTKARVTAVTALSPDDFAGDVRHRFLFAVIADMTTSGIDATDGTVAGYVDQRKLLTANGAPRFDRDPFPVWVARLAELTGGTATESQVLQAVSVVRDAAKRRRILDVARELTVAAQNMDGDDLATVTGMQADVLRGLTAVDRQAEPTRPDRFIPGGNFIHDGPDLADAVWGKGSDILWPEGEPFILCAPNGVGKTTIAGQLAKARIGLAASFLDLPVARSDAGVLYLAMDRPRQIRRSLRRIFRDTDRDTLNERMTVLTGPPERDLAQYPDELLRMCETHNRDTVFVDSMKDAFIGLSDDREAAAYNRARQTAIAAGVNVVDLHHPKKATRDHPRPTQLSDVYGSAWLTAGAGSVVMLLGEAGDPVIEMLHLKPAVDVVGPLVLRHDQRSGTTVIEPGELDAAGLVLASLSPLTAQDVADRLFPMGAKASEKDRRNAREKARRRLDAATEKAQIRHYPGTHPGMADVWSR